MSNRKDATYDLIMLALGAVDELWSRVFDSVKAWSGEETSDQVAEAMVGWRETYAKQQVELIQLDVRLQALEVWKKSTAEYLNTVESDRYDFMRRLAYLEDQQEKLEKNYGATMSGDTAHYEWHQKNDPEISDAIASLNKLVAMPIAGGGR